MQVKGGGRIREIGRGYTVEFLGHERGAPQQAWLSRLGSTASMPQHCASAACLPWRLRVWASMPVEVSVCEAVSEPSEGCMSNWPITGRENGHAVPRGARAAVCYPFQTRAMPYTRRRTTTVAA
eukprot:scaffold47951_cov31-Tisochrysis_lutea.AAC.5